MTHRFGPTFPRLFVAAVLQEVSFSLLIHFPGYLEDLGVSEATFGVLYAAAAVSAIALRPAFGRLLDLVHRRTVLLATGGLNGLFIAALALTAEWGPLLWALFLGNRVLQVGLFTTLLTYAADSIPAVRRTTGLAMFGLSGLFPIALGGVLGDMLIDTFGFDGLFIASAASMLISWGLVWTFPLLEIRGATPRRSFFHALVQRNLLPIWWVTFCFTAGMETLFTFTRTFVDSRQVGTAGLFFGVYGLSAALARIVGGRWYDRIPLQPLVVASLLAYGSGLVLLGLATTTPMFVVAAAMGGLGHGAVFPVLSSSVVMRARTSERGSAVAIFTALFDVALLVAAPVVGNLIEGFSYTVGFAATGTLLIVGGLVYRVWDSRMVLSGAMEA